MDITSIMPSASNIGAVNGQEKNTGNCLMKKEKKYKGCETMNTFTVVSAVDYSTGIANIGKCAIEEIITFKQANKKNREEDNISLKKNLNVDLLGFRIIIPI